jgi:pimeloyl-[acyl-carrier protein] methyl ester esterase
VTGQASVVLLPGLDGTGDLHGAFRAALAPSMRVEVVGYPRDACLDYSALESLSRDALPASTPFVLLGESFAGPIAISIAARPPRNLAGLVLSTSFASAPVPFARLLSLLTGLLPVHPLPAALLRSALLGTDAPDGLVDALRGALASVDPDVLRFRARLALRADVTASLARIRVPVLCLRAMQDRVIGQGASDSVLARVPHCEVANIPGPHLLLQARPKEAATIVLRFARDCLEASDR